MLATLQAYLATGIGAVIKAALLLLLAFIAATIVKSLVLKLLGTEKVQGLLAKVGSEQDQSDIRTYAGKLVYLLVFLLFVPGILSALGADSIAQPILGLLNTIWGYVPNILAAVIILLLGFFIARLIRQLLVPVFRKLRVDKLQEKAGIEVTDTAKLSNTLAYVVYVLIIIPVIIVALEVLNIRAISTPAVNVLTTIFNIIPDIIIAAVVIGIGSIIAKLAGQIVKRLIAATGVDAKLGELTDGKLGKFVLSNVVGIVVQVVIIVFFTVEGLAILNLGVLTGIGAAIIGYLPSVLAALIILTAAVFAAKIAEKALNTAGIGAYALPAKVGIYVLGGFMILNQLGIAASIVNSAFILIVAAVALAAALAFGLGGRDFAAKTLEKLSDKTEKKDGKK